MSKQARRARSDDRSAIKEIARGARRSLSLLRQWEKRLGDDLFVLLEREGAVTGALLAWPDESPVAWVRLAALADGQDIAEWLDLTLPLLLDGLRRRGTQKLAWMDYDGWAGPSLEARGFERLTDVIALVKFDRALPDDTSGASICLRPAADVDSPAVVAVDRAAFTPHWWHSEDSMRRRIATASHFVVAEAGRLVAGYAEGELRLPRAHLNRIAVHPDYQGRSIGASLLRAILRAFWQSGADQVSLNTQTDNHFSQQLYRSFGFASTGDVMTAWELEL